MLREAMGISEMKARSPDGRSLAEAGRSVGALRAEQRDRYDVERQASGVGVQDAEEADAVTGGEADMHARAAEIVGGQSGFAADCCSTKDRNCSSCLRRRSS